MSLLSTPNPIFSRILSPFFISKGWQLTMMEKLALLVRQGLRNFIISSRGGVIVREGLPKETWTKEIGSPQVYDCPIVCCRSCIRIVKVQESACPDGGRFGKRRKYAVLLSYSGKGYMGMQRWGDLISRSSEWVEHHLSVLISIGTLVCLL